MYKRILIKVSGEALAGSKGYGLDTDAIKVVAEQLCKISNMGVELAVVVGGGNFWRGRDCKIEDRVTSDYIGMLGTGMNALALSDAIKALGNKCDVMSALDLHEVADLFDTRTARQKLSDKSIVIFACGTGHPFFSTDTGAALRAIEIGAEAILMGKAIDAVYDSDPKKNPNAKIIENPTLNDIITKNLQIMDTAAAALCMQHNMPIVFFPANDACNMSELVAGNIQGLIIK
ncbi:MAG: UMP kinase [Clostridia bacterium]|nr:UMP kinase [Clostridia bacterium]